MGRIMHFKQFNSVKYYSTKKTFYVTTPIYYVNANPHIGHLYSSVVADATNRFRQLVRSAPKFEFSTGTDEYGTKIQQAASKNNTEVQEYCTIIANRFREMSDEFSIGYTNFIRTTSEEHELAVKEFWKRVYNNGHIYSSKYSGWYCIPDETFLTESQLKEITKPDGQKALVSIESGHPVEWTEEQNYMFRFSTFRNDLVHWLTTNDNIVRPKKFQKILLDMVSNEELPDVSISRPISRVHWGIKVPGDDTQTVYVWLNALVNYLTVAGYPEVESQRFRETWPADVHVIGKDILKFHGMHWPAFLLAADLEPPKGYLCHSHWTVDDQKMSKSKGNVVCPFDRSEIYGADGLRYFLLREGVAHSDGNYSDTKVMRILNSELADTLGNLLSRCCSDSLNPNQVFPEIDSGEDFRAVASMDVTKKLMESVVGLPDICRLHYTEYNFYKVADAAISTLHAANLFFETLKPWQLRKRPETVPKLNVVLHVTLETLRICSTVLQPITPNLSEQILNKLHVPKEQRFWDCLAEQSWNDGGFKTRRLSGDKSVVFRRLLVPEEKRRKQD